MTYSFHKQTFATAEKAWQELLPQSASNNVFLTPYWQKVYWETMGSSDEELLLFTFSEDDHVIGIAPMVRKDGVITFLGSTDLWDNHDFIVEEGREGIFLDALLEYLEQEEHTEIRLESLLEDSYTVSLLPSLAVAKGYSVDLVREDCLMGVPLPQTWDEYLVTLRKKDRHELRRKLRRLEGEENVSITRLNQASEISESMGAFLYLMAESREDKSEFLTPERDRFFRSMSVELAQRGVLQLFFLEINGVRTAATFCFDYNNVRYLYNSGYDIEYASLGTGFLLKALCLQGAISEGKSYFDLLRGAEPYKSHLGASSKELYRLSILR